MSSVVTCKLCTSKWWTDRSRVPKWLRQFGPWSIRTFKKRPKWPRTEVTKDRSGCNSIKDLLVSNIFSRDNIANMMENRRVTTKIKCLQSLTLFEVWYSNIYTTFSEVWKFYFHSFQSLGPLASSDHNHNLVTMELGIRISAIYASCPLHLQITSYKLLTTVKISWRSRPVARGIT